MDLSALKLEDDWWLGLFKWISIFAILLTLLAAVFVQFFTARVTRAMKQEISQSQQAASRADQRTEELKGENLKLSIVLEEERKARLDIQRRLQNRFLSDREKTILLDAAKPFRGHKIGINSIGSDPEPELYARQFVAIVEEAGWKVDRGYGIPLGSVDYGLSVGIGTQPGLGAQSLLTGLRKAEINFKTSVSPKLSPDLIILDVGHKDPR